MASTKAGADGEWYLALRGRLRNGQIIRAVISLAPWSFAAIRAAISLRSLSTFQCGRGGTGRRDGFRFRWGDLWGFESLRPHQFPDNALRPRRPGWQM